MYPYNSIFCGTDFSLKSRREIELSRCFYMHNWLCCKVPYIIKNIRDFIKTVKSFIKSLLFFIKPIIKNAYSFIKDCRRFIKNI